MPIIGYIFHIFSKILTFLNSFWHILGKIFLLALVNQYLQNCDALNEFESKGEKNIFFKKVWWSHIFLIKVLEIILKQKYINFFYQFIFYIIFHKIKYYGKVNIYSSLFFFLPQLHVSRFLFFLTCFCLSIFGAAFEKIITSRCLDQEHNNLDSSMVPTSLNVQENSYQ